MIHINRDSVPLPLSLNSEKPEYERTSKEMEGARVFFAKRESQRGQRRFRFATYKRQDIRTALMSLFHEKCAYCETRIGIAQNGDIEHYRPKSAPTEAPDHPGYWWLANEWSNLLISCVSCSRKSRIDGIVSGKANRFPLLEESKRAYHPDRISSEDPLLIDPCGENKERYPERHLVFKEDGTVVSQTMLGQTTISLLGLNRSRLVKNRKEHLDIALNLISRTKWLRQSLDSGKSEESYRAEFEANMGQLNSLTGARGEYAAMKRQFVRPFLKSVMSAGKYVGIELSSEDWMSRTSRITQQDIRQATKSFRSFEQLQAEYTLDTIDGRNKYRSRRRLIEWIHIANLKGIKAIKLDLSKGTEDRTKCLMMLGANGAGKSTVLQGIALALAGSKNLIRLLNERDIETNQLIRHNCKSALIKVKLSGSMRYHAIVIRKDRIDYTDALNKRYILNREGNTWQLEEENWVSPVVLVGYGSTRLLPKNNSKVASANVAVRIENLFDPFIALSDASKWLMDLNEKEFNRAALILKDVLDLSANDKLKRGKNGVRIQLQGKKIPLFQLSDGYQSVLATTVDILQMMMRIWSDPESAEGIVLIDEVGAHLHPDWQLKIVSSVRRALPGIQFICSTHQPLCLRGMSKGEIVVMFEDRATRQIAARTELPDHNLLSIDQLLTSSHFGLLSTVDHKENELFNEYYELGAMGEERSAQEEEKFQDLKTNIGETYVGKSMREVLMYEVIDEILANEFVANQSRTIPTLRKEAIDRVKKMWDNNLNTLHK